MANGMNKNHRVHGTNDNISKYYEGIVEAEKKNSHRRIKARALCTHTREPFTPALAYRDEGGQVKWVCKICGEPIDLRRISDADLKSAINTINQACDFVKLMTSGNERDTKLVEEVIAEIQLKVNAYLYNAYTTALNSSNKRRNQNGKSRDRRPRISWGE